ncbi:MAG: inositol monophosphatase family protein [Betaproteobacteria bacterium]|nr:inositol monophosphatase family protein [Betaproteobacteria bacterium]
MLERLIEIAKQAGAALAGIQGSDLEAREKSRGQLVTRADEASHALIEAQLERSFSGIPRVMEEQANKGLPSRPYFVVDELDGTIPFARGMREWAVMLAYVEDRPTAGVIFLPAWEILIAAEKGRGCRLNGKQVRLGTARGLADAVVGLELNLYLSAEHRRRFIGRLSERALSIRSLACAGAAVAELLLGRTDLYVNCRGGKVWDFASGALAVEEAGGVATRIDGTPIAWDELEMDVLLAANAQIADEALNIALS